MKNLLLTKTNGGAMAYVSGKVTKNGVTETEAKGKKIARLSLSVSTTDYDLKGAEYALGMKDAHIATSGENAKYPLVFVEVTAWEKTAEMILNNVKAGDVIQVLGNANDHEYNGRHSLQVTVGAWGKDFTQATETVVDEDLPF